MVSVNESRVQCGIWTNGIAQPYHLIRSVNNENPVKFPKVCILRDFEIKQDLHDKVENRVLG